MLLPGDTKATHLCRKNCHFFVKLIHEILFSHLPDVYLSPTFDPAHGPATGWQQSEVEGGGRRIPRLDTPKKVIFPKVFLDFSKLFLDHITNENQNEIKYIEN